jgi:uncharacterized protein (DUF58 family)
VRLRLWIGPRGIWALCFCALLFFMAGAFPVIVPLAWVAAGGLAIAFAVDAAMGPPRALVRAKRLVGKHFALRSRDALVYEVRNESTLAVRAGIVDGYVPQLEFEEDEVRARVPARAAAQLNRHVKPVERGEAELGAFFLWYENPIGLLRRRVRVEAAQAIRIYPDLSAVERYGNLHARNKLIEAGLRKMRLRGSGTEFESLREWGSGDAFRAIDWKATARRGKLMVAQHEVERSQNIMILLDCGRLMTPRIDEQRKFDYAITAALSVATIAGLANDKVGFLAFANDVLYAAAPRPSKVALLQASERLYGLEPRFEESDYGRAFSYVRTHLHKRSLIVLFTDMFDPVASAVVLSEVRTLAQRHMVVCVFMNDAAIEAALHTAPSEPLDVYRAGVAAGLADERRAARAVLTKIGVRVVDAPAAKLSVSLIDAYLDIKQRALL